eukprot:11123807-Prorocentrum_lima.AAC.1
MLWPRSQSPGSLIEVVVQLVLEAEPDLLLVGVVLVEVQELVLLDLLPGPVEEDVHSRILSLLIQLPLGGP